VLEKIDIVKIGGFLINEEVGLESFLDAFARRDSPRILIHGGGRLATELATKLDIPVQMVEGRRITDADTLQIAVMAYAGWANKQIVAGLQARGVMSIGLSGADGNLILSHRRTGSTIDYGYVGDIDQVNSAFLNNLLNAGITPVICAITHDGHGQLLNTNADTIAAEVAIAARSIARQVSLSFCFEYDGVLADINRPDQVIPIISILQFENMKITGAINKGMIPKMSNGFNALKAGCNVTICGVKNLWSGENNTVLCL
jgi:acetylglutamate kinase